MKSESIEALVVRLVDYGEADRIATLLTPLRGKVSVLARGARRSRKRYAGLSNLAMGDAAVRETRGELWALDEFHARRGFGRLGLDVAQLAQAAYACELARELCPPHQPEPELYAGLTRLLATLEERPAQPAELRAYEMGVLDALGLAPSLADCIACGRPLAVALDAAAPAADADEHEGPASAGPPVAPAAMDPARGGVVCHGCAATTHGAGRKPIDGAALAALRVAQSGAARDPLPSRAWELARDALQAVLAQHLGHALSSVEFIGKMNASLGAAPGRGGAA